MSWKLGLIDQCIDIKKSDIKYLFRMPINSRTKNLMAEYFCLKLIPSKDGAVRIKRHERLILNGAKIQITKQYV